MIARSEDWKNALAEAVRDPAELLDCLELPRELLAPARAAAALFPLRVPRGFLDRMEKGNPADPLLRQVLPLGAEGEERPGFTADPVGDRVAAARPGLLHKYRGRVLLTVTGACAIHCRYCFRRHFPYGEENPARHAWQEALDYLRERTDVQEVILSGGDPLVLDDVRLGELVGKMAALPHLRRLRVHSRLPIVLPERVTAGLCGALNGTRLRPVFVVHANHPAEIDANVLTALERLRDAGIPLLNQAVLLKGINDSAEVLADLSTRLFEAGVMPYYLHLLDRVRGAAHFEVPESRATEIVASLRTRLSGYLVPRLVREETGAPSKLPVF